jgi:hypothetical protein
MRAGLIGRFPVRSQRNSFRVAVFSPIRSLTKLGCQFLQQRLRVFQVGGVEAFGEPAVDVGEYRPRFVGAGLPVE